MQNLEEVLGHYGIKGKVAGVCDGPVIRQIAFEPEAGTKLKNILAAEDDIARELGISALRVEPIDGSRCLGFEIPEEEMRLWICCDFEVRCFCCCQGRIADLFGS